MCFIFSLQAVMAADVQTDDTNDTILTTDSVDVVNHDNNDSLLKSIDNDKLSEGEGSFAELEADVSGTDVVLTRDYTYAGSDTGNDGIQLSGTKTIDGEGKVTIDANYKSRIFVIENGATITLKGITFKNAFASGNGGAILANGKLILENCTFIDCSANGGNGGAVFLQADVSKITNCNFENNRAIRTADTAGSGGALMLAGSNIDIIGSTFTNNKAGLNVVLSIGLKLLVTVM